ncbi:MAG: S-methyl-5'-thioadenosine phosphorylase [Leptospiraceae bacterium]|nr:S-methyl-5'-thioadenosine phosphorylase [Leptospiraceae bacterium]
MKKATVGIIGGTGVYEIEGVEIQEKVYFKTPWGYPSDEIVLARYKNLQVAFLARHGRGHFIPPSRIPARANIASLKKLGVEEIIAFSAVGSLREELRPGDFVLPDQIIDRTKMRQDTFYDEDIVVHVSFGEPFSKALADVIYEASQSLPVKLHRGGTLICMEGPLFSTRAESRLYRMWGADIINMTVLPEAKLAREAEIAYQMICMSTDYDSWRAEHGAVEAHEILAVVKKNSEMAQRLLKATLDLLEKKHPLSCFSKNVVRTGIITARERRSRKTRKKLNWLLPGYF